MEGKGADITEQVLGAAIAVHSALGPGPLESTALPVVHRGVRIDCGYRLVHDPLLPSLPQCPPSGVVDFADVGANPAA